MEWNVDAHRMSQKNQRGGPESDILTFCDIRQSVFPHFISTESVFCCAIRGRAYKTSEHSTLTLVMVMIMMFVSSDRSFYSDRGLLYIQQLFEILSISANIFSFSFCQLNAD